MKTLAQKTALATFVGLLMGNFAIADTGLALRTTNASDYAMWVTIYGGLGQADWGCVPPHSTREWRSGNYRIDQYYAVRGEIKEALNCGGETLCDTQVNGPAAIQYIMSANGKICQWTRR